jgi:hypothetical protein
MLEEGVGDHCHEGVPVKPSPGSSFEVIEPKFFLELLMGLRAEPTLPGSQLRRHWLSTLPRPVRSGLRCRAGTSVVVPCGQTHQERLRATQCVADTGTSGSVDYGR